jgi:hypothetical protein
MLTDKEIFQEVLDVIEGRKKIEEVDDIVRWEYERWIRYINGGIPIETVLRELKHRLETGNFHPEYEE